MLAERVVEIEILIIDELCDAVHLVLAVVHDYFGVGGRDDVDLTRGEL